MRSFLRHGSDPLGDEGEAFGVGEAAAEFGHGDVGLGGGDAVGKNRRFGVAWDDVVIAPARASTCCGGCFKDANEGGVGLGCGEVEASTPGTALGRVAVSAVYFEIGAGTGVEGSGVGIVPYGEFGCILRIWCVF